MCGGGDAAWKGSGWDRRARGHVVLKWRVSAGVSGEGMGEEVGI